MRIAIPLLVLLGACGPKDGAAHPEPTPVPDAGVAAEPTAPTPEELAKRYLAWIEATNAGDWDTVASSFAAEVTVTPASSGMPLKGTDNALQFFRSFAVGFPDLRTDPLLVLARPGTVAAVALSRGTNTVEIGGMPATNAATSFVGLTVITFDDSGKMTELVAYADNLNYLGHLGQWPGEARPVVTEDPAPATTRVIGSSDASDATVKRWAELYNAHDAPSMIALYTPDATFDDSHLAGPLVTPAAIANHFSSFFPAFPDTAVEKLETWSAGPYVVATYRLTGTNGGNYQRLGADETLRQLDLEVGAIFRMAGDKIADQQLFVDGMAMAYQLGIQLVSPPAPPAGN